MRRLNRIDIFGHRYRILHRPIVRDHENPEDDAVIEGFCFPQRQEIVVAPDLHPEEEEETLGHECIEAANAMMALGLDHHQVTVLGNLFFQLRKQMKDD
jgi:hypothetical protein